MAADGVTGVITRIGNIAEAINMMTSDEDQVEINGRSIKYEVRGHFHHWKFVWDCRATDVPTGISIKSKDWKSRHGALDHGIQELFQKLEQENEL